MRILHTSDWHIGRTFHGHSTDEHLALVLDALAAAVREHGVDVVVVAGDVFDSSTPKAEAFTLFARAVKGVRDAGARVVVTSGNHDGPARLAHNAAFASAGGVHIKADHTDLSPVTLTDEHGDVLIYGIPYLHPEFMRSAYEDFTGSTHQDALTFAMDNVRADVAAKADAAERSASPSPRYVVAAHCFAAGLGGERPPETTEDSGRAEERDITRGGLNLVDISTFDGAAYVALGHIHSRQQLSETVRYSGAPLRFSFGERSSTKGVWLVDIDANGTATSRWLDLPTPREAVRIEGTLAELMADGAHESAREAWVEVVLTDDQLPREAMRTLQERYPHAVTLTHRPANVHDHGEHDYAALVEGKTDAQVFEEFLAYVRNGAGPTAAETALFNAALDAMESKEASR
ncbi:exonuclease SbcCD subunit D [Demequina sp. B12]|uniref:exonuclease SbcCD subunit D n=1 Tax=Demequina sp. B12 TaxID=2992757 RepID=UPI00237A1FC4|nr:exonuclease SbcCD subunit D [Demequina sp. B12]MDE0573464.1 exonuclease SbcCD subunit D [Demequina sp. B12]